MLYIFFNKMRIFYDNAVEDNAGYCMKKNTEKPMS